MISGGNGERIKEVDLGIGRAQAAGEPTEIEKKDGY